MKPVRRLCYMLLSTWRWTKFNSIPSILILLTNKNVPLIYSVCAPSQRRSFQHKLLHRCFYIWCLLYFKTIFGIFGPSKRIYRKSSIKPPFSNKPPLSKKPRFPFQGKKVNEPPLPPPSLLSPSSLLNTKFFQIWSSVAGYGGLCVCF